MLIAFQMDDIRSINVTVDSTFLLMLEAQRRGYTIFYYTPDNLVLDCGKPHAQGHFIRVKEDYHDYYDLLGEMRLDLSEANVVWIRQDPPFDMAYITTTYILEMLPPQVLVVNHPFYIRNCSEKLFACQFPDLIPPTLVSRNKREIEAFREEQGEIIVKPLYGCGGESVFYIRQEDKNFNAIVETLFSMHKEPLMVQQYIPEVKDGDKRIILIDGEIAGAIRRVPATNDARANIHIGGHAAKVDISERDREICTVLASELQKRGLLFVGLDIIGEYLIEINVTSPTCLREMNYLYNLHLEQTLWDCVEEKLKNLAK